MRVSLRAIRDGDLAVFYSHSNDPQGIRMAAFTAQDPSDRAHFDAHWARIRLDPSIVARTVVGENDEIVGYASVYGPAEEREVTYWRLDPGAGEVRLRRDRHRPGLCERPRRGDRRGRPDAGRLTAPAYERPMRNADARDRLTLATRRL